MTGLKHQTFAVKQHVGRRLKGEQKSAFLPEELSPSRSHLDQAAHQPFSLHHGWGVGQPVSFGQATGDASGCRALPGRYNDAHAGVAAASHGTTAGVHHEADQEPARCWRRLSEPGGKVRERERQRAHHGHR